jgi:5-methylcytosine-specific restriction endonuclease McrA
MAKRIDRSGEHRRAFDKNKQRILKTQEICGICGRPVDKALKYPHPLSASVDHIIPVSRGGHPSDIENLQLAHWTCNRQKSDKMTKPVEEKGSTNDDGDAVNNNDLPTHFDWLRYAVGVGRR